MCLLCIYVGYRHDYGSGPYDENVTAWYENEEPADEEILVWVSPADDEWAVYHGSVYGPFNESESTGHETKAEAVAVAELWLTLELYLPTPIWPL